jgi:hypothetical protein
MTEKDWVENIKKLLLTAKLPKHIGIKTLVRLPYAQEIIEYDSNFKPKENEEPAMSFETDLLIYEQKGDIIKPRIVVEAKLKISSHDAITYSYKAQQHKIVTPYLRYGIMLGNRKHYSLPGRLFRHGANFDFMINFKKYLLDKAELNSFVKLLRKKLRFSRQIESMLSDSRKKK